MTTILIVDDHALVRSGLTQQVRSLLPTATVLTAGSAELALHLVMEAAALDLIILDLNLPDGNGLTLLKKWHARMPLVPVIVVSGETEQQVSRQVMSAGAAIFVTKSASESTLREAIAKTLKLPAATNPAGALDMLSARQQEVLRALVAGMSNLDIANHMNISELTVKAHLTAIFKVLGVVSRTQAVLAARAAGW